MKTGTEAITGLRRTVGANSQPDPPLALRVTQLTAELEGVTQELEAFSYAVSHDLRAPLRHILGYTEILQSAAGQILDETNRRHLHVIAQSAVQMGQMLDAALTFARMGRAPLRFTRVGLAALVEKARGELLREIGARSIKWQIGDLPEVLGDPAMLGLAIRLLLSNAIKFTRTRPKAKIEIGAKDGSREITWFVRDNGVGFDRDCAGNLFGLFQRLHQASGFEGAGLGLAQVRRILRRHGGRTWAEGKVDGGATFYFSIPKPPDKAT